jgi:hypothetical protein
MSVRVAELAMAILMGVFSLYLMVKSAELPIGWIPDEGPGGGAWPFWLSVMMLLSCVGPGGGAWPFWLSVMMLLSCVGTVERHPASVH